MTIIDFVRLILKHLILLIIVPLLLASMVIAYHESYFRVFFTNHFIHRSCFGSSIEMDKTFNYQATNTAFDNLINIIESRNTRRVAIRLLVHLMLPEANLNTSLNLYTMN
jgi:hexokinase